LGLCLLAAPELVVGAVVITGVVVVAVAIQDALEASEQNEVRSEPLEREHRPECKPKKPCAKQMRPWMG
jgi:hypothetical protein